MYYHLVLNKDDSFTVWSILLYIHRYPINCSSSIKVSQEVRKMKVALKTKIFMWFLKKRVIWTKDKLARRDLHGST
jgi:hypothetical protein